MPEKPDLALKYSLYERAVQSPEYHAEWVGQVYRELRGKSATRLREDFCGTFRISCEWAKLGKKNIAVGLDLDPEPLSHGKKHHWASLPPETRSRVQPLRANVLKPTREKFDIILACNFSFFIFHRRDELLRYLEACRRSLAPGGILILEMSGGPGMIEESTDRMVFKETSPTFTYFWEQRSFDPISRNAKYAIHFRLQDGRELRDAFTYDWRLWTIPEVRDALKEAGFADSSVYWETTHRGEGTGEYLRTEHGDNAHAWIAYAVGMAGKGAAAAGSGRSTKSPRGSAPRSSSRRSSRKNR